MGASCPGRKKEMQRTQKNELACNNIMTTTEEELQELYVWVDQIQFSRPKRNIARDFSDGVLLVGTARFFFLLIMNSDT
jgi:hypothetical protein